MTWILNLAIFAAIMYLDANFVRKDAYDKDREAQTANEDKNRTAFKDQVDKVIDEWKVQNAKVIEDLEMTHKEALDAILAEQQQNRDAIDRMDHTIAAMGDMGTKFDRLEDRVRDLEIHKTK